MHPLTQSSPQPVAPVAQPVLTARQLSERVYYDRRAQQEAQAEVSFDVVWGQPRNPWNTTWRVFGLAAEERAAGARALLDFGCGAGKSAVRFAAMGFQVHGFDISENQIAEARRLAARYGFENRTTFSVQAAEALMLPSDSFDLVIGFDVLHHVEIEPAVRQCLRVLRPGGMAVFREHLEVPVFDAVRNWRPMRRLLPKGWSRQYGHQATEHERKLTDGDLQTIRGVAGNLHVEHFSLLSRLDLFVRTPQSRGPSRLEMLDFELFHAFPRLRRFGGTGVLTFRKSGSPANGPAVADDFRQFARRTPSEASGRAGVVRTEIRLQTS
ncbi:MAG: class I SAM-dependent methyltransferase [Phycisphaerae bacterium]|nr:class I SAM-dependent methyltransferase [Phycisphaerae bacterium]